MWIRALFTLTSNSLSRPIWSMVLTQRMNGRISIVASSLSSMRRLSNQRNWLCSRACIRLTAIASACRHSSQVSLCRRIILGLSKALTLHSSKCVNKTERTLRASSCRLKTKRMTLWRSLATPVLRQWVLRKSTVFTNLLKQRSSSVMAPNRYFWRMPSFVGTRIKFYPTVPRCMRSSNRTTATPTSGRSLSLKKTWCPRFHWEETIVFLLKSTSRCFNSKLMTSSPTIL